MFDDGLLELGEDWNENWAKAHLKLKNTCGFVIITPEWDGLVPGRLKNFFNLCCDGELYYKPALIIAVSASNGGAYPIAELRMSSYKNCKICYLPEHMIIRNVGQYFNEEVAQCDQERYLHEKLHYQLAVLLEYVKAFQSIRASKVLDMAKYPYGD